MKIRTALVIILFASLFISLPMLYGAVLAADHCPSSGTIIGDTIWKQEQMYEGKFACQETDLVIDGATLTLKFEPDFEYKDSVMDVKSLTFKNSGDIKISVSEDVLVVKVLSTVIETVSDPYNTSEIVIGTGVGIQVLSMISLLSVPNTTAASIFGLITQAFLGRRHLKKLWGLVYDSSGKKPIPFAVVRLLDSETNLLISSTVTDLEGRYGFPVSSGSYYIEVQHEEYTFPSKRVQSSYSERQGYIYTGGRFNIQNDTTIDFSIPLDAKDRKFRISFQYIKLLWIKIRNFALQGNFFFLAFMFVLNLFATVLRFNPLNLAFSGVYFFLIALKLLSETKKPRAWGYVFDSETKAPVSPSFLKLYKAENNELIDTKIANRNGIFQFFVPEDEYLLLAAATGYKFPSESLPKDKLSFHDSLMKVGVLRGVINIDVPLDYQSGASISPFSGKAIGAAT
ncbi:MAG: carboxypeptidase-like regulatory domain-containing protein [Patescibacteria group bacterium]